ncbi:DUF1330 domain-containing protein [Roseibium porphyridii]|uniref:DUF1330 domain-containing protein n=1 Tax=Roseibium porphyridii TaxID=2866279 RepID=A0ABY8EWE7_9HYPH|nr:DUF1330 domain-containing protein [Roseibium sp. KMA01]WFE87268.1 DUF1330 domain-containing protein [Roseibium sp. KMA01]
MNVNQQVTQFTSWYGSGSDGACPTENQWSQLLDRPADHPVTLINFFKLRPKAEYSEGQTGSTGQEAFSDYASVSMPAMERAGGNFLYVGPYQGMFMGEDEDWDLIAIGSYPNLDALIALYSDETYRGAFHHRTAACERQKVLVCGD